MKLKNLFILFLLLYFSSYTFAQNNEVEIGADTKKTKQVSSNFYFTGIKLGYGSFSTGVEIESKSSVKVTHLGIRLMFLFNTGDYTNIGITTDLIYSKRGYKLFENSFFGSDTKLGYYGFNALFNVKHKWFYFGAGYEALFWDRLGLITFEHKEFEHFVTMSFGYIYSGKVKFFIGVEIKTALFKLNSFEYEGETYSPGVNSLQEYLVSVGIGF